MRVPSIYSSTQSEPLSPTWSTEKKTPIKGAADSIVPPPSFPKKIYNFAVFLFFLPFRLFLLPFKIIFFPIRLGYSKTTNYFKNRFLSNQIDRIMKDPRSAAASLGKDPHEVISIILAAHLMAPEKCSSPEFETFLNLLAKNPTTKTALLPLLGKILDPYGKGSINDFCETFALRHPSAAGNALQAIAIQIADCLRQANHNESHQETCVAPLFVSLFEKLGEVFSQVQSTQEKAFSNLIRTLFSNSEGAIAESANPVKLDRGKLFDKWFSAVETYLSQTNHPLKAEIDGMKEKIENDYFLNKGKQKEQIFTLKTLLQYIFIKELIPEVSLPQIKSSLFNFSSYFAAYLLPCLKPEDLSLLNELKITDPDKKVMNKLVTIAKTPDILLQAIACLQALFAAITVPAKNK